MKYTRPTDGLDKDARFHVEGVNKDNRDKIILTQRYGKHAAGTMFTLKEIIPYGGYTDEPFQYRTTNGECFLPYQVTILTGAAA